MAWLEQVVNSPEYGKYAVSELKEYGRVFQEGLASTPKTGDPLDCVNALAVRLLRRWLERRLVHFGSGPKAGRTGTIDTFLIMMTVDTPQSPTPGNGGHFGTSSSLCLKTCLWATATGRRSGSMSLANVLAKGGPTARSS